MGYVVNHPCSGSFDGSTESVSSAVIAAVATHRETDPTQLPPLYEWIDPDALDALFTPVRSGPRSGRLEFTYDGHTIAVDCTDGVSVSVDGSASGESIPVRSESATRIDT
ncbi:MULTISPECIES: HalOD1 output domain-containing protein [unclassified Natrinema]|uniref:HalOD1 output domain-containing protein n=1 Tax=unclassified Natrinema TaxID=2622230 RepID=UPI000677605A|nr:MULTISPECIES: HalOD1 output domain-containing protein [unclassified Natrinema]